jgi:undecaprenyl-diphosphatase
MDAALVLALHQLATTQAWFGAGVSVVAQTGIFLLPIALLLIWLFASTPNDGRREAIVAGVASAVVAMAVGLVLERTLNRPRPFVELGFAPLFPHAADSSFPSDHTLVGVALIGPMLWQAPKLGIGLLIWALIVGFARVAAGVHYPTDIVGSALLALALDGVVWVVSQPVRSWLNLHRWDGRRLRNQHGARRR